MTSPSQPASPPTPASLPTATLSRLDIQDDEGIFGFLRIGRLRLVTGELPWHDNTLEASCIPPGTYRCVPADGPALGLHFEVFDVPGRSHVLIYAGTWYGDKTRDTRTEVRGSILLGLSVGIAAGQMSVLDSDTALAHLSKAAPDGFMLEILDRTPGARAGGS